MRDYVKLAGTLLIICIVAAASLGYTNYGTYDKIIEQQQIANDEAKKTVLPDAETFEELDESTFSTIQSKYNYVEEIDVAKAGENIIGYAVKVAPNGYGGTIDVVVGVSPDGSIQGIKVGTNSETPGLGKKSENQEFQDQFRGKTWDSAINVIKSGTPKDNEIVALSGSTVTSKAVTDGVNQALEAVKELSNQ